MTVAEFQIPGGPKAPSAARELLCEWVGTQLDPALIDTARLLVSEIVTNCVVHAGVDESELITVRATRTSDGVRTEICHRGPHFVPPAGEPDLDSPGGLGLYVVEHLSDAWGVESGEQICVWFELDAERSQAAA